MEYESQNVICQNCKVSFTIEPEDFRFYEKIKVPPPTWCPECRMIRRISCNNGWYLHYRNCDKCGKRTLSMYPPEKEITVYCQPCWWADDWDGTEYSEDYDESKPFLKQLEDLSNKTSFCALETTYTTLKNCDYCNGIAYSKNCVLTSWADFCENVCYSSILNGLKFSSDCIRGFSSELCYGSIGFSRCYRMFFSDECDDCVDVYFSRNCYGCSNCIGCVNLKRKQYCILNKQYSKEEYFKLKEKIIEDMKNNPYIDEKARSWSYGEFFQSGFNKMTYNNSNAFKFFPKSKEEIIKLGHSWYEEKSQNFEATISANQLPETIELVHDSTINEIISCINCDRKYKILQIEFDLLRKMGIPLPKECPRCREDKRFIRMNKPGKLYNRKCDQCQKEIQTPYTPDRPEIIYCEECYKKEVY